MFVGFCVSSTDCFFSFLFHLFGRTAALRFVSRSLFFLFNLHYSEGIVCSPVQPVDPLLTHGVCSLRRPAVILYHNHLLNLRTHLLLFPVHSFLYILYFFVFFRSCFCATDTHAVAVKKPLVHNARFVFRLLNYCTIHSDCCLPLV